jgi:hypothetical protein
MNLAVLFKARTVSKYENLVALATIESSQVASIVADATRIQNVHRLFPALKDWAKFIASLRDRFLHVV